MRKFKCPKCSETFSITDVIGECPDCGSKNFKEIGSDGELWILCCGDCRKFLFNGRCPCPRCGTDCLFNIYYFSRNNNNGIPVFGQTSEIKYKKFSKFLKDGYPVFLMEDEKTEAVLMSMKEYDWLVRHSSIIYDPQ